jgi:hypothetical protein
MAAIVLAAGSPPVGAQQQDAKADAQPGFKATESEAKDTEAKDTRLSLEDIRRLRGKHTAAGKIADMVAEQGRAFDVTEESDRELRKLGFAAAQIAEIKDASTDPLVPGKWLSSDDAQRDATLESMRQAAVKSGAAIQPVASQHITLWAAKGVQKTYLADLEKAEKFFHTKCAEPIRSGLDKRSAHVVLLSNRAEYMLWWRAMLDLNGKLFEVKDNPNAGAQFRQEVFKSPIIHTSSISVICAGEMIPEWVHRNVAFGVGFQYTSQLSNRSAAALQTGFGNWVETVVCGSPAVMGSAMVYGKEADRLLVPIFDWGALAKQRLTKRQATLPSDFLKADQTSDNSSYVDRWALVGLLNQQPVKFGKLLLALKDGDTDLPAIEKIYGWNEKELDKKWRAYVLSPGKKKPAAKRD